MERWEEGRNLLTALSPQLVYEGDLVLNARVCVCVCARVCVLWNCNFTVHTDKHTLETVQTQAHTVLGDQLNPLSPFLYMKGTAVLFHINEGNSIMLSRTRTVLSHSISLTGFISFLILFLSPSFFCSPLFYFFLFFPLFSPSGPHLCCFSTRFLRGELSVRMSRMMDISMSAHALQQTHLLNCCGTWGQKSEHVW